MSLEGKEIVKQLVELFEPLTEAVKPEMQPNGILIFLRRAGIIQGFDQVPDKIKTTINKIKEIASAVSIIANGLKKGELFSQSNLNAYAKLVRLSKEIDDLGEVAIGNLTVNEIGTKILNYLLDRHTAFNHPALHDFLYLIGSIKEVMTNDQRYYQFSLDPLFELISDPAKWFKNNYGWGGNKLEVDLLLLRLKLLLEKAGVLPYFLSQVNTANELEANLMIPLFRFNQNNQIVDAGLKIGPAKLRGEKIPKGLRIWIYGFLGTSDTLSTAEFQISYNASANSEGVVVEIFPGQVSASGGTSSKLKLNVNLEKKAKNNQSTILIGAPKSTRLEMLTGGLNLGAEISNKSDFSFEVYAKGGKLIIEAGDGDGFIQKILPQGGIKIDFEPAVGWSYLDGISLGLSAGLETTIPIHRSIGPVNIGDLHLKLALNRNKSISFTTSVAIGTSLGPIKAAIGGMGMELKSTLSKGGNLGFLDFKEPKFVGPKMIGVELDAQVISGGGFLEVDTERGRYAGGLSLKFMGIEVNAIALILTKLPNGKKGFSMLVSISTIFTPAFQLSFGFTLAGVGGLVGINRTFQVDAFRARLSDGGMNSVMFPANPIQNADRILGDLEAIFPSRESHFVVAPFLRLGFGTPSIIELDLGIILEFPFNGRILLLGSLGIYLPVKGFALVEIHIDVIGDFNFAEQYIRVEGRLRDSSILGIALSGGFAFMLDWGNQPAFLFSIGGYHPRYKRPARFPEIPRLNAYISLGGIVRLSCDYYQAITSNSFQVGSDVYMEADFSVASIEAHFGFNTLIMFNPFHFSIDQIMSIKVKVMGKTFAGIECYYCLSGPAPWRANGYAEVSILFFSVEIPFDISWGAEQVEPPVFESIDSLLSKTQKSLRELSNWRAVLPKGFRTGEKLLPATKKQEEELVLHPSGFLEVRQNVLPFNRNIEKFGNSFVENNPIFSIADDIKIGGVKIGKTRELNENFARGQFTNLSEADKLSSPDFEEMMAGLSFEDGLDAGFDLGTDTEVFSADHNTYEQIILQREQAPLRGSGAVNVSGGTHKRYLTKSLRAATQLAESGNKHLFVDEMPEVDAQEVYLLVDGQTLDLVRPNGIPIGFKTYDEAKQYLKFQLNKNKREEEILVMSNFTWANL